jgi:hypothetical protein
VVSRKRYERGALGGAQVDHASAVEPPRDEPGDLRQPAWAFGEDSRGEIGGGLGHS